MNVNIKGRRKARKRALQALYQWQLAGTPAEEIIAHYEAGDQLKDVDVGYFKGMVLGVVQHVLRAQGDRQILQEWPGQDPGHSVDFV